MSEQALSGVGGAPEAPGSVTIRRPAGAMVNAWPTIVVVAIIFAGLQVMSWFTPEYIVPGPRHMLIGVGELLATQWLDLLMTVARLIAGVLAALVVGSVLGGVMGLARRVAPYSRAFLFILSGVPALSWILLAVLWFPQPELRIFFILFVMTVPFYALNVYEGILALPTEWVEMMNVFRPTRMQTFRVLVLPHVVPYIVLTSKSVAGYAIRMIVFAELIAASAGVGARLAQAQSLFRIDRVFAWTILLVVLNFAMQWLVNWVERRLLSWRPQVEFR